MLIDWKKLRQEPWVELKGYKTGFKQKHPILQFILLVTEWSCVLLKQQFGEQSWP